MRRLLSNFRAAVLSLSLSALVIPTAGMAQTAPAEPGGDPASANLAQTNPDEYAWRLFDFINLQAAPSSAGVPASGKTITQYDDDTATVWETWALASGDGAGQEGSEVFKPDGSDPGTWNSLPRAIRPLKVFSVNLKVASALNESLGFGTRHTLPVNKPAAGRIRPQILLGPGDPTGDFEVRLNQAAFEFTQKNDLYNIEGLTAKFEAAKVANNRDLIQFPPAAKEVKANWVTTTNPKAISADEKARYHWRQVGDTYYKLTGFHVTTKDLKQWFWADFAQEDFETTPGPALPSRDSTTRGAAAPDRGTKDGERKELVGSKWAHYRLRGTQIDFLDASNKPVIVGNTQIEANRADKSSCMTCHFNASMAGVLSDGSLDTLDGGNFVVGEPNAAALGAGSTIKYLQNDFEWSAPIRAQHKTAHP